MSAAAAPMSAASAAGSAATRPRQHFTPLDGWMNDPNGLVFHEGRWHLFFQHNPEGSDWGNMSWGHAWSTDLRTWHEEPVAIPHDDDEDVFSGSVVVALPSDTPGAPRAGDLVAVYTSAATPGSDRAGTQAQAIATSADGGRTWTKRRGGPVLDRGSADFRDPHVFRWSAGGRERWVMVAVEAVERAVLLYASDDLVTWHALSRFDPVIPVDGIWECPDLFPLSDPVSGATRWVLLVSVGDGHPAGGSGMLAFIGDFDGTTYTSDADPEWVDWGRDCYAGITFTDAPDERRIMIAWMSNWQYAHTLAEAGRRWSMTMPRELRLAMVDGRLRLVQHAPDELAVTRTSAVSRELSGAPGRALRVTSPDGDVYSVLVRLDDDPAVDAEVLIEIAGCSLTWSPRTDEIVLERPGRRGPSAFSSTMRAPLPAGTRSAELHLDVGSVELLAGDGAVSLTALLPTFDGVPALTIQVANGVLAGRIETTADAEEISVAA